MDYNINGKIYKMPSKLSPFQEQIYKHLIDWKHTHITIEPGEYRGNTYDLMFPNSYYKKRNISPIIYRELHEEITKIQKGEFAYKVHLMAFHMASSQCACINLFLPILLDTNADEIISNIQGCPIDFAKIDRTKLYKGFCFEYWGQDIMNGKGLLNDHSNVAGTDADIAIAYINTKGEKCLWLIEHKLTETDFTNCGGYKSKNNNNKKLCKNNCLEKLIDNPQLCHYHKIGYKYWSILQSKKNLFNPLQNQKGCPFQDGTNQLFRNQVLAFALENTNMYKHVYFSVVHHKGNTALEKTMNKYRELISNDIKFTSFTNYDVIEAAQNNSNTLSCWINWYRELYNV